MAIYLFNGAEYCEQDDSPCNETSFKGSRGLSFEARRVGDKEGEKL